MKRRILSILTIMVLLFCAIPFAASAATTISSVAVRVVAPEAGRTPRYEVDVDTEGLVLDTEDTTYGACQSNGVIWFCNDLPVPADQPLEVGKVYKVRILLIRESEDYTVANNATLTINGQPAYLQYGNYMYLSIEYTFPALEGHTVTFNNGGGSGSMAPVTGVAGDYTLPACGFTAPYSSQAFKCWRISGSSDDWFPGEEFPVYGDITVTAVWKAKDSRSEVTEVRVTSEDLDSIPVLYGKKTIPDMTTTHGSPAYVTDSSSNLQWQRKEGDTWVYDNSGRFTPGEWRIITQVRIDSRSDPSNQFVLGSPLTLTVNGKAWISDGNLTVEPTYSCMFFVSPSFVIADNPNVQPPAAIQALTFGIQGYANGASVDNAMVTGDAQVNVLGQTFFEANSVADMLSGDPGKIREATGKFSADKVYVVSFSAIAKSMYTFDEFDPANATFAGAQQRIGARIEDETFVGVYILTPLTSAKTNPFVDVKKADYFYDPVLWAVSKNITNGMDATHFAPEAGCTRAQVVTFLWRAAGKPTPTSKTNPFVDVKKGEWYYDAVLWAVEKGITTGMDATHFAPDSTCTRSQIVTFLWRYAGKPAASGSNPFADVAGNAYYYDAVRWAVKLGITNGMDATHFAPDATCTRGQIVTFLYRYSSK